MDGFSILDPTTWRGDFKDRPEYIAGQALVYMTKAGALGTNHYLTGRLYVSKSGWLLLSVPNALVRGVFDAMSAPGVELPTMSAFKGESADNELLNAHISVMTAEEVEQIGADKINERGHHFHYALGQVREFSPKTDSLSRVWAIQVASPELAALRKSYGLTPLPNGDHQFHITVAVRRKKVLAANEVAKVDGSRGTAKAAADQPRVRVVLPYQGKYLLETLNNPKWPQNLGKRRFIGGGVEEGETHEQAAAREMFEELGVKVKPTAFRALGSNPALPHEHYLELAKHKIAPGDFNASVGSDAVISLSPGMPAGADYMGADLKTLLAPVLKKAADLLPGGAADNEPDSEFPPEALAEGKKHEREHTNNAEVAKEIAKDHLSEDPAYYEKVREIEREKSSRHQIIQELLEAKNHSDNKRYGHKVQILRKLMEQAPQDWLIDDAAPKYPGVTHTPTKFQFHTDRTSIPSGVKSAASVYLNQALQAFNPAAVTGPTVTTPQNKTLLGQIHGRLSGAKQRGDFALQAERNHQMWRAQLDPNYRYQLAIQAFRGQLPTPSLTDQVIERYGDGALASLQPRG